MCMSVFIGGQDELLMRSAEYKKKFIYTLKGEYNMTHSNALREFEAYTKLYDVVKGDVRSDPIQDARECMSWV